MYPNVPRQLPTTAAAHQSSGRQASRRAGRVLCLGLGDYCLIHAACGLTSYCDLSGSHRFPADRKAMRPECAPARHVVPAVLAAVSVEVEFELSVVAALPVETPADLRFH